MPGFNIMNESNVRIKGLIFFHFLISNKKKYIISNFQKTAWKQTGNIVIYAEQCRLRRSIALQKNWQHEA